MINVMFTKVEGESRCRLRVSDLSMRTDGLVLLDKITSPHLYCLNPGYYYLGCEGPAVVNVNYVDATKGHEYDVDHDLIQSPYWKVLKLEQIEEHLDECPRGSQKARLRQEQAAVWKARVPQGPDE